MGPGPVDRGRRDSKHHLLDGGGLPRAWTLTAANRNDVTQLLELLDRVPPVRGRPGRPQRRPRALLAFRGYDHDKYRWLVWQRGVEPVIARRSTEHGRLAGGRCSCRALNRKAGRAGRIDRRRRCLPIYVQS
jgi:hypothetical protein